ncbi:DUF3304 domain-containing protein [Morganella psychrotolerans]|uniref:DUF3304 domain-containing protein n=1 Tax=Morganella psychrotolerans TaxID=368603 RepID=UPI00138FACCB|nr:DUF3304 domain-containing protein [Morganella psychrotolerans]
MVQPNLRYLWKNIKPITNAIKKIVPIPEYDDPCDVQVHFLPCQEVKISLSCWSPWDPNYPVKEPLQMKEPAVCPN